MVKMSEGIVLANHQLDVLLDSVRKHNQLIEQADRKCPPACIGADALHQIGHLDRTGAIYLLIAALDRLARTEPL